MSKHAAPSTGSSFKKAKKAGIATAAGFALASAGIIGLNGVAQAEDLTDTTQSVNAPAASVVATDAQTEPLLSASTADKKPAAEVKKASTETTSKPVAAESPVENTTTPVQPAATVAALSAPADVAPAGEEQQEPEKTASTTNTAQSTEEGSGEGAPEADASQATFLISGTVCNVPSFAPSEQKELWINDTDYSLPEPSTDPNVTPGGAGGSSNTWDLRQLELHDGEFTVEVPTNAEHEIYATITSHSDGDWGETNRVKVKFNGENVSGLQLCFPSKHTDGGNTDTDQGSNTDNNGGDNTGDSDPKNTDAAGDKKPAVDTDTNNNGSAKPVSSTSSDTTEQSSSTGKLAQTGASSAAIAAGMLLVGLGAGAVVVARRRQKAE